MKIENVIDRCNDCRYCKQMVECGGNTFYTCICMYGMEKDTSINPHPYTVLASSISKILERDTKITIPDNCPLEDYKKN